MQITNSLPIKPAPFQPDQVQARQMRRITHNRAIRNNVARDRRHSAHKGMRANAGKLVHSAKPAQYRTIANAHAAADLHAIGNHNFVANPALMRQSRFTLEWSQGGNRNVFHTYNPEAYWYDDYEDIVMDSSIHNPFNDDNPLADDEFQLSFPTN